MSGDRISPRHVDRQEPNRRIQRNVGEGGQWRAVIIHASSWGAVRSGRCRPAARPKCAKRPLRCHGPPPPCGRSALRLDSKAEAPPSMRYSWRLRGPGRGGGVEPAALGASPEGGADCEVGCAHRWSGGGPWGRSVCRPSGAQEPARCGQGGPQCDLPAGGQGRTGGPPLGKGDKPAGCRPVRLLGGAECREKRGVVPMA